jgi:glycine betaine/proline transport system substrate-binding protein
MSQSRNADCKKGSARYGLMGVLLFLSMLLLAACGGSTPAKQGDTGTTQPGSDSNAAPKVDEPIIFAGFDWESAAVHNGIARYIIENGYGHKTTAVPGSTIPMIQGLMTGDVDVLMEVWYENSKEAVDKARKAGSMIDLGINFADAVQGFWVPTYMIKGDPARGIQPMAPDLKSVDDLKKYKDLFRDPEDPSKGRFYDCIAGWDCERVNEQKFKAYELGTHFNRFLPGTGAALDASLAAAYKKGEPWLGYYWGPTWILGKYDMTMLEEPDYTKTCWDTDKKCAYPMVEVTVAVHSDLHKQAPHLVEFLTKYETSGKLTSEILAYMQDNKAEAEDAAVHFLKTKPDIWTKWVPADVAAKVTASLK